MAENERMGESASQRVGELMNGQDGTPLLPDGWVWATVEEIAEQVNSGFPSGKHNTDGRGVPHLRPMNISPNGDIDLSLVKYVEVSDYDALRQGDVLFNNTNSPTWLGKTTYIRKNTNWAYSNHMTRVRLHPGFDSGWVAYALHHLFLTGFFRMNCRHHVNQASINTSFLSEKVSIPFPPVPEQRRIVAEIETQFTRLDAGVAALERARANLRRYKASVLKAACEGRLVPTEAKLAHAENRAHEPAGQLLTYILAERRARWEVEHPSKKYKEPSPPDTENLPELPEGWVWARVSDIGEIVTGTTPRKSKTEYYGEDFPFYKPTDLNAGYYTKQARDGLSRLGMGKARLLSAKSILVTCIGATIGKTGFIRREGASNQQINAIVPEKTIMPEFIYFVCVSPKFQNSIIDNASSTTLPILNKSRFKSLLLPLPPLAEQHRIVAEVERRLSVVAALEASVEAGLARARRLRQSILKRAFEGRLVPQDPDDKPAPALLEKIRGKIL